ncbi:ABC transporter ATP-binding protein [Evansella sp. AB-P1]|uniref:ABC transporter ATP-binding protein n=1 Tax=Evansella sp. AB-P1 TaxID=3037653 RepID=UPI00241E3BF0|nr:ABC transporter ATP-binding protein [Evansella sp. AB-P1]MDG5789283.1 ABC transporter ATP-binding protein [Evansella sp. AB-P1]
MSLISLEDVTVAYDNKINILEKFNLNVEKGKLISLLGPSGCGKTTTLRLIAGFLEAKAGKFTFKDKNYTNIPVYRRNFGFVFQNYALFPHLNVFENVAFGLKQRKVPKSEIRKRVPEMLELVDLNGFEDRFVTELSGGQRQRVAIARALVINPDLLLFDEPLSNLDANLRIAMRVEIRRIQQELGITSIYVSHDQEECFSISDEVAIMNKGVIEQLDSPSVIYKYPKTEFVARFIGFTNFIDFEVESSENGKLLLNSNHSKFRALKTNDVKVNKSYKGVIRPESIKMKSYIENEKQSENSIKGSIKISTFLGGLHQYVVNTELGEITVNSDREPPYDAGENVILSLPEDKLVLVEKG